MMSVKNKNAKKIVFLGRSAALLEARDGSVEENGPGGKSRGGTYLVAAPHCCVRVNPTCFAFATQ